MSSEKLKKLFDIAINDAEEKMWIQGDIEFLRMQTLPKGRHANTEGKIWYYA